MPDQYNETDPVFLTLDTRVIRGERRPMAVAPPAAGADWNVQVPGGRMWRLFAMNASFTASAVVANRFPACRFLSNGLVIFENLNQAPIAAANTFRVIFQPGMFIAPNQPIAGSVMVPFYPMWLIPGDQIGTLTVNMDVGDQWSQITLIVEEAYFDPTLLAESYYQKARAHAAFIDAMEHV